MPVFAAVFLIMTMSSIGLPALNGFIGELLILQGVFIHSRMWAAFAASGIVLGAAYMLWLYQRTMFGKIENPKNEKLLDLNLREVATYAPLLVLAVWIGIYPAPFINRLTTSVNRVMAREPDLRAAEREHRRLHQRHGADGRRRSGRLRVPVRPAAVRDRTRHPTARHNQGTGITRHPAPTRHQAPAPGTRHAAPGTGRERVVPPGIQPAGLSISCRSSCSRPERCSLLGVDLVTPRNRQGVLAWVSLGILAATALAVAPIATTNVTVSRGLIAVDGFGLFFKVVFLLSAAVTILMSAPYLQVEARAGEYYFLILCATLGMMFMAGGIDLITIFIGLETMAVSFYILTGYIKPDRRSNEAAVKYFLLGAFSLGILLYGMSLLCGLTGSTHLRTITELATGGGGRMLVLAVILLVAASDSRSRPCRSMWAPDVYEGAPTPVTAFLSVGSKAASFAMLLGIFLEGLPAFASSGLGVMFGAAGGRHSSTSLRSSR